MKKKVAFIIRDLNYGGAQRQLIALVKGINKQSFDVTLLYFYSGGLLLKDLQDSDCRIICLDKQERWDILGFFWCLFQHLKRINPDVLHGYLGGSNIVIMLLKPFFPSTRIIWGIRGSHTPPGCDDGLGRLLSQLERLLSYFTDLIVVNSHAGKDDCLSHGFAPDKMVLISNGIDTERFQPNSEAGAKVRSEWGISENIILIGLVGRLDPMKDHPTFLRAAALLCKERQDVHFVCVGIGSEKYALELQQMTNDLGIYEQVIWVGGRSDMPAVFNALNINCSSSSYGEGFPNVIGEAMACGVPCVVTDVGDSAWIVGDTGIVVPLKNPEALAAGWYSLLNLAVPDQLALAEKARKTIIENFSMQKLVQQTEFHILRLSTN